MYYTVAYSKAQQKAPSFKKDKRAIVKYQELEDDFILRSYLDRLISHVIRSKCEGKCLKDVSRKNLFTASLKENPSCYCSTSTICGGRGDTESSGLVKNTQKFKNCDTFC